MLRNCINTYHSNAQCTTRKKKQQSGDAFGTLDYKGTTYDFYDKTFPDGAGWGGGHALGGGVFSYQSTDFTGHASE